MLFSSTLFILWFLPLFLLAYVLTPGKHKNAMAFSGSLVFYAWGAPVFCFVLLISAAVDYFLSFRLEGIHRKSWLALGVGINVLTLFVFKYFNFFAENVRRIADGLGLNFADYMEIALPLGISFFTFQKISYLVDVYRGNNRPAQRLVDYCLFVFLFPQLIAGPIVRYKDIVGQIVDRSVQEGWTYKVAGFQRFVLGLVKKVLIADALAPLADAAFSSDHLSAVAALTGLLAYTFQIYYDFSGYSDMAIGLGMMMGFRFPENFDWPYVSHGFREFWRKWHMTLSTWMRDYLYVPLGGNRVARHATIINLWIVFLLSGLWHGASWNFIIWGAWHGLFISIDRFTGLFSRLRGVPAILLTFTLVILGWIWFRADSIQQALNYFSFLTHFNSKVLIEVTSRQWFTLITAIVFSFMPAGLHGYARAFHGEDGRFLWPKTLLALLFLLLCLGQIAITIAQPFIYFRF